jgi:hypothetical protein
MTTLDLDARGVTEATPAILRKLVASHGGIVARKEIGHISRLPSDSETKESPWSVAGRWLGDLGPSYGRRPEDHAIDGAVIYAESPPIRTSACAGRGFPVPTSGIGSIMDVIDSASPRRRGAHGTRPSQ